MLYREKLADTFHLSLRPKMVGVGRSREGRIFDRRSNRWVQSVRADLANRSRAFARIELWPSTRALRRIVPNRTSKPHMYEQRRPIFWGMALWRLAYLAVLPDQLAAFLLFTAHRCSIKLC